MLQAAKEAVPEVVSTLAIMRRRQRLLISAEIPLVTVLCLVRVENRNINFSLLRPRPNTCAERSTCRCGRTDQHWPASCSLVLRFQVGKPRGAAPPMAPSRLSGDRAAGYQQQQAAGGGGWTHSLLPVYSVSVIAARAMCKYKVRAAGLAAHWVISPELASRLACATARDTFECGCHGTGTFFRCPLRVSLHLSSLWHLGGSNSSIRGWRDSIHEYCLYLARWCFEVLLSVCCQYVRRCIQT